MSNFNWPQLREHLCTRHPAEPTESPGFFWVKVQSGDRLVSVGVLRIPRPREWVVFVAKVCELKVIRAQAALVENRDLAIGGFCAICGKADEVLGVRQSLPLAVLSAPLVAQTIEGLTDVANGVVTALERPNEDLPFASMLPISVQNSRAQ